MIRSIAVINEVLHAGKAGGGMSTGFCWQPFEISAEEYHAVIAAWKAMNPQEALYPRGASVFIEDPDIPAVPIQQFFGLARWLGRARQGLRARFSELRRKRFFAALFLLPDMAKDIYLAL